MRHDFATKGCAVSMAVVLGGAECVERDLAALREIVGGSWPGQVVAVNEIGVHRPRLDHWASVHPEKLIEVDPDHPDGLPWTEQRARKGLTDGYVTWTHRTDVATDRHIASDGKGSSGYLAVEVADQVGCRRIVLCGVPLDERGWFDGSAHDPDERFLASEGHQRYWHEHREWLQSRVRSMSGWTRELLGAPTRRWLGITDPAFASKGDPR